MYNSYLWDEPPGGEYLRGDSCPICNEEMEWQTVNFQFYCCSCDECFDAKEPDYYEPEDFEERYAYGS